MDTKQQQKRDEIKLLLKHYKPPFRYLKSGAVIVDSTLSLVFDVRGFGRLEKFGDEGMKAMDLIGERVAKFLNQEFAVIEEVSKKF